MRNNAQNHLLLILQNILVSKQRPTTCSISRDKKHRRPFRPNYLPILYERPHNYDWSIRVCNGKKACKQTK